MQIGHSPGFYLHPDTKKIEVLGTQYSNDYSFGRNVEPSISLSDEDFFRVKSRTPSPLPSLFRSPQPRTLARHIDKILETMSDPEVSTDPLPRSPRALNGRLTPYPCISPDETEDEKAPASEPVDDEEIIEKEEPVLKRSFSDPKLKVDDLISRMPPEMQARIAKVRQERIEHEQLVESTKEKAIRLQERENFLTHKEQLIEKNNFDLGEENILLKNQTRDLQDQIGRLNRVVDDQMNQIAELRRQSQENADAFQRATALLNARQLSNEDLVLGLSQKAWIGIAMGGAALIASIIIIVIKVRK